MTRSLDEVVVNDGSAPRGSRIYRWFLDHLAKFPGRVTAVTFAAGVVVTVAVVMFDGENNVTTVVSLVATLWALFFAVMIYLLTARDTDRVLEQIEDLHEQLATALAAPDAADEAEHDEAEHDEAEHDEEVERSDDAEEATGEEDVPSPVAENPRPDEPQRTRISLPGSPHTPDPRQQQRQHPSPEPRRPRVLDGAEAVSAGVPSALLDAWIAATGRQRDELTRAWSRDPRSDRQWVLETDGQQRWVVFSRDGRGIGVLPLDQRHSTDRRGGPGRDGRRPRRF